MNPYRKLDEKFGVIEFFLPHLFNILGFPTVFFWGFFQALKFSSVVGTFDKASCFNES